MANTFKSWTGAVEPAESSPSGNEFKAWTGAVEPVGAAAAAAAGTVSLLDSQLIRSALIGGSLTR